MPVVSKAEAGKFGAELARRKKGLKPRMKMSTAQLEEWLQGVNVKRLPTRKKTRRTKRR